MKTNNIQIFNNSNFGTIRTITNTEGETFFVGRDVATALGYSNTRDALNRHVDKEDRDGVVIHDSIGRQQKAVIINERQAPCGPPRETAANGRFKNERRRKMKEKRSKKESNKEEAKQEGRNVTVFASFSEAAAPQENLKIDWPSFIRFYNATLKLHGIVAERLTTVEQVDDDVGIKKQACHLYFFSRCL